MVVTLAVEEVAMDELRPDPALPIAALRRGSSR
jgi:hypothetical protein